MEGPFLYDFFLRILLSYCNFWDDELAFYETYEELVSKIKYFKENEGERQRVAKNGWHKIHAEFNEIKVAKYLIETTMGQSYSENYIWSWHKFER